MGSIGRRAVKIATHLPEIGDEILESKPRVKSFMDYVVSTAAEMSVWAVGHAAILPRDHPLRAKRVGESATVLGIAKAVVPPVPHLGLKRLEIPIRPDPVSEVLPERGSRRGAYSEGSGNRDKV